jgi:hypothetical protein
MLAQQCPQSLDIALPRDGKIFARQLFGPFYGILCVKVLS